MHFSHDTCELIELGEYLGKRWIWWVEGRSGGEGRDADLENGYLVLEFFLLGFGCCVVDLKLGNN